MHLQNLQPGTKYYYRVVSQEISRYSSYYKEFGDTVRSDIKSFTTWSDQKKNFRVIVCNDLHSNMQMFDKLHSFVESKPYDLVIFNGDCFDDVETEADILNRLLAYTPRIKSDEIENYQHAIVKRTCMPTFWGEPTVKVSETELGGRNQPLALYLSTKIDVGKNIINLCEGTDGTDGPTDVAGAVIDNETMAPPTMKNINPQSFLKILIHNIFSKKLVDILSPEVPEQT